MTLWKGGLYRSIERRDLSVSQAFLGVKIFMSFYLIHTARPNLIVTLLLFSAQEYLMLYVSFELLYMWT